MKQKIIKTGVVAEGVDMRIYRSVEDPRHVAGSISLISAMLLSGSLTCLCFSFGWVLPYPSQSY